MSAFASKLATFAKRRAEAEKGDRATGDNGEGEGERESTSKRPRADPALLRAVEELKQRQSQPQTETDRDRDREVQAQCRESSKDGDFAVLGQRHGTDKVTHHGYHRFYPRFLEGYRHMLRAAAASASASIPESATSGSIGTVREEDFDSLTNSFCNASRGFGMLEIGIDRSKSLKTWLDYFPSPTFIYGMDIKPPDDDIDSDEAVKKRHLMITCDQSNLKRLSGLIAEDTFKHHLFFILDDGSHIPEHQLCCFNLLFHKLLLPGGTYIIEDIETSYWTTGGLYGYKTRYGYRNPKSVIEVFKHIVDEINNEFLSTDAKKRQQEALNQWISVETRELISSVTFGQNCVIVVKKTREERIYQNRPYRFENHL